MLRALVLSLALGAGSGLALDRCGPAIDRRAAGGALLGTTGALLSAPPPARAAAAAAAASVAPVKSFAATGQRFPLASFGLQIYDDATAERLTLLALEAGFRNFFASVLAGNQRGFARAIKRAQLPRDELFICGSVVSNRAAGFEAARANTREGCAKNLAAFAEGEIGYVDQAREQPPPLPPPPPPPPPPRQRRRHPSWTEVDPVGEASSGSKRS